jgi:integrase
LVPAANRRSLAEVVEAMAREILVFGQYKVRLFQRRDQPSNYWFMRVQVEGRPYKRSLKTCVLELAREAASQEMIEILAKLKAGQKVFPTSLKQARDEYLVDQQKRVTRDKRSKFTIRKITQRVDRAMEFLKDNEKLPSAAIDSIEGKFWQQYIDWRLKPMPDIRRDGINDELVTIRAWFEWCQGKGWCSQSNIPQWELELEKQQATRDKIPAEQITEARRLMAHWYRGIPDSFLKLKRTMVYAVFNTMLFGAFRTGEILQVQYKELKISEKEIVVTVRDTTSKVRKTRQVPLVGDASIWLFDWINLRTDWQPDDLVFSTLLTPPDKTADNWQQKVIANIRQVFYREFGQLRKDVLIPAGLGEVEAYHARHYCITNWLLAGHSIHLVAKVAGTSVAQIEKTYSGIIEIVIGREFARKTLVHKADGSFEVLTDQPPEYTRKVPKK